MMPTRISSSSANTAVIGSTPKRDRIATKPRMYIRGSELQSTPPCYATRRIWPCWGTRREACHARLFCVRQRNTLETERVVIDAGDSSDAADFEEQAASLFCSGYK